MKPILEYINEMSNARTDQELWHLHLDQMRAFGFDRLFYGYTRYRTDHGLGAPEDWIVLTNHTPEYMETWERDRHYQNAPMIRWALNNTGPCSWRWVEEMIRTDNLTPAEKETLAFNREHGVMAGYTISFNSLSERARGAISLVAPQDVTQQEVEDIWAEHGDALLAMNNAMHLKLLTLPYSGARRLTKRQREVLQWVGDGKTTQDIAILLGLTAATIEKHLRLAREALDVETTAQAVLKAAFYNQMFVVETGES